MEKLFREDLKYFKPYKVGKENYKIKLDANESFIKYPKEIEKEILNAVQNTMFNRYPDEMSTDLRKLYGEYIGADEDNIIVGNGSDELIQIITNTFLDKGDKAAMVMPDFSMYDIYTKIARGSMVKIPLDDQFNLDIQNLIDTVNKERCKVLFLSNPNNPIGRIIKREDIIKIIENCNSIVVIDEAYMEFYGDSIIDKCNCYKNLIVLRTCSKALGAAAIRLGFLIANTELVEEILKVKPPFNVNALTQNVGSVLLKDKDFIIKNVNKIIEEREYLYKELREIDEFKVYKSYANFILLETKNSDKINDFLIKKGIKLRSFKEGRLKNFLRITVGTREENNMVLDKIRNF